jgi:hypothetical protein
MDNHTNNLPLIIGLVAIVIIVLYYSYSSMPVKNQGTIHDTMKANSNTNYIMNDVNTEDLHSSYDDSMSSDFGQHTTMPSSHLSVMNNDTCNLSRQMVHDNSYDDSIDMIDERARGRNNVYYSKLNGGKYHRSSYDSKESNLDEVDKQFRITDIEQNHTDRFVPTEECTDMGAPITIDRRTETAESKHNVDDFLPKQENKDWHETIETVNVKNSHLLNTYRPVGVNTIGTSNRNASYDLRGNGGAITPKTVVSPWLQSSIEPSLHQKTLCE